MHLHHCRRPGLSPHRSSWTRHGTEHLQLRLVWALCWHQGIRLPHSGTSMVCKVMSCESVHSYPPGLVSGSNIRSCSWAWMLSTDHPTWSPTCLPFAVPQPSPGSPRRPACMTGNGLCPCSPCRCACTGWPAPYTMGGILEVPATCPPTMPHHRLPMQGAQDGRHHSHSAGTGHPAHPSSPSHATTRCITAQRGTEPCKLQRSSHPGPIATSLG